MKPVRVGTEGLSLQPAVKTRPHQEKQGGEGEGKVGGGEGHRGAGGVD